MTVGRIHTDEVPTDAALVRRLLAAQFPQWAHLPITPVASAGTDNAMYRLGDGLAVRLPRQPSAAGQVIKESHWLPRLAPHLPLPIPRPAALGQPAEGYPWNWLVCEWLDGEDAEAAGLADARHAARQAARDVAAFLRALQAIDASGAPPPGVHNSNRGAPLATRDAHVRGVLKTLQGVVDTVAAEAAWQAALHAPAWRGPLPWIHGDMMPVNLLARDGRLCAVIDFGCLGAGDPACDLMIAWTMFDSQSRPAFRAAMQADDAAWARGRGWALSFGLIALPYYARTNPLLAAIARRAIDEVLAEHPASA